MRETLACLALAAATGLGGCSEPLPLGAHGEEGLRKLETLIGEWEGRGNFGARKRLVVERVASGRRAVLMARSEQITDDDHGSGAELTVWSVDEGWLAMDRFENSFARPRMRADEPVGDRFIFRAPGKRYEEEGGGGWLALRIRGNDCFGELAPYLDDSAWVDDYWTFRRVGSRTAGSAPDREVVAEGGHEQ